MNDVRERIGETGPLAYQLSIIVPRDAAEHIAAALEDVDTAVTSLFERADGSFELCVHCADPGVRDAAASVMRDAAGEDAPALRIETVGEEDWVTFSQGKRAPVRAGRFLVHGAHDRSRVPPSLLNIEIDAGLAFGTAHHASTRGCLLALDDLLKRRGFRSVLDIGTGSGVLAIAIARALRRQVLASDIDPVGVAVARENARKNRAHALVRVVRAGGLDGRELRHIRADLMMANILARPLHALAPALARATRPGGIAILSGLTKDQANSVEARYRSVGFVLKRRIIIDGWATLVLARMSFTRQARAD